jgi:Glycosyl transferase family 2
MVQTSRFWYNSVNEAARWYSCAGHGHCVNKEHTTSLLADGHYETDDQSGQSHAVFSAIPTTDAAAALQFCRQLYRLLATKPLDTVASGQGNGRITPSGQLGHPSLSVVIPVFNEQENLPVLYSRLKLVLDSLEPSHELIFVDDGSRDHSSQVLRIASAPIHT